MDLSQVKLDNSFSRAHLNMNSDKDGYPPNVYSIGPGLILSIGDRTKVKYFNDLKKES